MRALFTTVLGGSLLMLVYALAAAQNPDPKQLPPKELPDPVEPDTTTNAAKRAKVWKALLANIQTDKRGLKTDPISLYAESPDLSYICFKIRTPFYVYDAAKDKIARTWPKDTKTGMYNNTVRVGLNSMSYEEIKGNDGKKRGAFVIWYYGALEGIIDPLDPSWD